ncbi:MAG: Omp28-related outer membrane protein [Saprospiraceae bacterium]|nr:Omp28-related outer membrane protein [Saprospiraceae bacterium]
MKKILLTIMMAVFASATVFSQAVLVEENFNGTLPADWSVSTLASDGGWNIGSAASIASQFWPVTAPQDGSTFIATNDDACNCDKSADRLIFPALDLSAQTGALFLSFDLAFAQGTYGATEALFIEVSYDGGTTWETVTEVTGEGSIAWRRAVYDVSMANGNAAVNFAFRYNDGGGWLFGAAIDNVTLSVPVANDMSVVVDDIYRFASIDGPVNVTGSITNLGGQPLTSYDIVLNDGTNDISETVTGIDVAPLETVDFEIPVQLNEPTNYDLTVNVSMPNGEMDANDTDNGGALALTGVTGAPGKMLFLEESTGTWCPWCPRGAVFMDLMEENFPESIAGVAVHVGAAAQGWPDPMEVTSYATEYAALVSGFPTLVLDRTLNPGIPGLADMIPFGESLTEFTRERPSPIGLNVDASVDGDTREMTIDLDISAHSNIDANYSVAVLITEDHVTGPSGNGAAGAPYGYDQANNYAGGGNGPMGGWENLGTYALGENIEYNHTLRHAIGGFNGDATLIPATIAAGDNYQHTMMYTVPDEFDLENINVVAIILDQDNNGASYNAHIDRNVEIMTVSVQEIDALTNFEVFPNPTEDVINVNIDFDQSQTFTISVIDVLGNRVRSLGNFSGNSLNESFNVNDLASGLYLLSIQTAEGQNTLRFTKQ